jgi:hypothetical protein
MSEQTFKHLPLYVMGFVLLGLVLSGFALELIRRKRRISLFLAVLWYLGWLFCLMWIGGLFVFAAGHAHRRSGRADANELPAADAAIPLLFHFAHHWRGTTEAAR